MGSIRGIFAKKLSGIRYCFFDYKGQAPLLNKLEWDEFLNYVVSEVSSLRRQAYIAGFLRGSKLEDATVERSLEASLDSEDCWLEWDKEVDGR